MNWKNGKKVNFFQSVFGQLDKFENLTIWFFKEVDKYLFEVVYTY